MFVLGFLPAVAMIAFTILGAMCAGRSLLLCATPWLHDRLAPRVAIQPSEAGTTVLRVLDRLQVEAVIQSEAVNVVMHVASVACVVALMYVFGPLALALPVVGMVIAISDAHRDSSLALNF